MEREQLKKEDEERQVRLQDGARKHNEVLNSRKYLRNEEVTQLKVIQDNNVDELKAREKESDCLRIERSELVKIKTDIDEEFLNFQENLHLRSESIRSSYNMRRIKMLLRDRSDAIRKDLKYDIDLLQRISVYDKGDAASLDLLREKFEMQYDLEIQKQGFIEAMYESEAKIALIKQQEVWLTDSKTRERLLKGLIGECMQKNDSAIAHIEKRLQELDGIRKTHRQAIDDTIERIKDLMREQKMDDSKVVVNVVDLEDAPSSDANGNLVPHRNGVEKEIEEIVINSGRPKFGRKKIAWT